jgi:hypothetical protein
MATLTLITEAVLGLVGLTIALGAPLVGMFLHHREVGGTGLPLVGSAHDVAAHLERDAHRPFGAAATRG